MPRSNSSDAVGLMAKIRYNAGLFKMMSRHGKGDEIARLTAAELCHFRDQFEKMTGKEAACSSVLEIGFGAHPYRALALSAIFKRVIAIDLDAPIMSLNDALSTLRRNGIERTLKSVVRYLLFDRRDWPLFHREMKLLLPAYDPTRSQLVVGSAGETDTWSNIGDVDLILSIDVFEHIPKPELARVVELARQHVTSGGIMIAGPNIFTGISGGHNLGWYPHQVDGADTATAWSHLLDPEFIVNTYLNRMTRKDYREIFANKSWAIDKEEVFIPRLGENHLTDERRTLLADYSDEELFSNRVDFYLAPARERENDNA